jgi:uncharacterized Zn finger protein
MAEFGRTWWGDRFLKALERFTDPGRLGRGRSYARNGKILEYRLNGGTVQAKVRGSINPYFGVYEEPIYTTKISLAPIKGPDWDRVIAQLSSKASFVARLLMNEMPEDIDEVVGESGVYLLPHSKTDFTTDCSCPDWSNPCKHIAGVYYLLASDLDSDPFLLFELRGLSRDRLRRRLAASPLGKILSAELVTDEQPPIEPVASYYTPLKAQPAAAMTHREFWSGARRLPNREPQSPPRVPALLIKKQGDYPPFWNKDTSFIEVMEEVYRRVREKSLGVR